MEKEQVIIAILLGTSVLILLAGFLLFFLISYRKRKNEFINEREKLKKEFEQTLLKSQVEVQENTFTMVSRELHDNVNQLLLTTKALLGTTERNIENPPEMLRMAQETLAIANNEVRSLSKILNKEWLQQFNLIDNLSMEVTRINAMQTLEIAFTHSEKLSLQPEEQLILFRIVQEALQNSVKHSKAEKIDLAISHSGSSLVVNITDNGNGFQENQVLSTGMGRTNMRQRTQLLGGSIEWISSPGKGSTVILKLPAKKSIE